MLHFFITDASVQINTARSDGTATEGDNIGSLQVCVNLMSDTATEFQDDVIVPLIVVANKAGMLNLG